MRSVVLGNRVGMDAGFVGSHLRTRGFRFEEAHREAPGDWPVLGGVELVVTLGSVWHVDGGETASNVEAECAFVREAIGRGIPLFAVCFGAQVLSHALGGTVSRAPAPEIGWTSIDTAPGAPEVTAGPWMEWHHDAFTAPEGFDVLGHTGTGPQLIAGRRVVGTQFHPEATETMVRDWVEHGGAEQLVTLGGDPDALLAETRRRVAGSRGAAASLVDWFLERSG